MKAGISMKMKEALVHIHNLIAVVTEHKAVDFTFEGNAFRLSVDTFKGDVLLYHNNGFLRYKLGRYREQGDTEVFASLLNHWENFFRDKNTDGLLSFLLSNQKK